MYPPLTPLLLIVWGIVLVALFIGVVLWEWRGLRADDREDYAPRDRSGE